MAGWSIRLIHALIMGSPYRSHPPEYETNTMCGADGTARQSFRSTHNNERAMLHVRGRLNAHSTPAWLGINFSPRGACATKMIGSQDPKPRPPNSEVLVRHFFRGGERLGDTFSANQRAVRRELNNPLSPIPGVALPCVTLTPASGNPLRHVILIRAGCAGYGRRSTKCGSLWRSNLKLIKKMGKLPNFLVSYLNEVASFSLALWSRAEAAGTDRSNPADRSVGDNDGKKLLLFSHSASATKVRISPDLVCDEEQTATNKRKIKS